MPGKTDRRRTTVYFDREVYRRLKVYCAEKDISNISDVVNAAVQQFLSGKR
jgi:hypothetical protein